MTPAPSPAAATTGPAGAAAKRPEGAVHQRNPLIAAVVILGMLFAGLVAQSAAAPGSQAAAPLTVAQAVATQNGSTAAVTGYIVGQPTSATSVLRSGFTADTAIAIADSAAETNTAKMLYVQVTTQYRSGFGLQTTPSLMGTKVDVTGQLTAYFSHAGLKSPSSMALRQPRRRHQRPRPTPTPHPATTTLPPPARPARPCESSLHQIISVQQKLSYDQVWDALKDTDQDPANTSNVILLYTGRSQSKSTNGGGVDDWNREHVWAKSHGDFGTATGPGTDVHHLRPTDVTVNSARGNKDFDLGGTQSTEAPGNYTDADSWEPRNAVKGDVARMIMYMAVRYEGGDGFADLEMNNFVNNGICARTWAK